MKIFFLALSVLFTGCSQLLNGQEQPVVMKKQNLYFTTCSGAVENMGTCNKKAMTTCPGGYLVIERFQDAQGVTRSLTFECKK